MGSLEREAGAGGVGLRGGGGVVNNNWEVINSRYRSVSSAQVFCFV